MGHEQSPEEAIAGAQRRSRLTAVAAVLGLLAAGALAGYFVLSLQDAEDKIARALPEVNCEQDGNSVDCSADGVGDRDVDLCYVVTIKCSGDQVFEEGEQAVVTTCMGVPAESKMSFAGIEPRCQIEAWELSAVQESGEPLSVDARNGGVRTSTNPAVVE